MKKYLFLFLSGIVLLICGSFLQHCTSSEAAVPVAKVKSSITGNEIEELAKIGFTKSSSLIALKTSSEREAWTKKGFVYISQEELGNIMAENNWFIGPANAYIGNIPADAAKKIANVYNRLSSYRFEIFVAPDGRRFTEGELNKFSSIDANWIKTGTKTTTGAEVFVVAPSDKFDQTLLDIQGGELKPKTKNPDPIVVVKINNGYIELARW